MATQSLDKLAEILRKTMPKLRSEYSINGLWIFGSFVRGEEDSSSDVDILVEFDKLPTLLEFVRLQRTLSDLLGVKVDLVMKTALKPTIGRRIMKEAVAV